MGSLFGAFFPDSFLAISKLALEIQRAFIHLFFGGGHIVFT